MIRSDEKFPLPPRKADSHKGTYGRVLLVAGCEKTTGWPILAARAAYRSGAGLVTVGINRRFFSAVSTAVPEAVFFDTYLSRIAPDTLNGYEAVLVGPGLFEPTLRDLVWALLEDRMGPIVVDADTLDMIAADPDRVLAAADDRVWTPTPEEFTRLTGERPRGDEERVAAAERFVWARGGVLVLKGRPTVVMDGDRYAIEGAGNPGMATSGAGIVLGGMISAFLGQGMAPFEAARAAVRIHGLAGDLAAADLGEIPLMASDIIDCIPRAIRNYQEEVETDRRSAKGKVYHG